MKHVIAITLGLALSLSVSAESIRLSEPVVTTETSETFGRPMDESLPKVSMATLKTTPDEYLEQSFRVTTRIAKVCQKKGCFFIAQDGEHVLRVSFRDYGFFIPTDSGQKQVTLTGHLVKKELTEKQAAHFREDLKDDNAALQAGIVYEMVADSVRIPKHG